MKQTKVQYEKFIERIDYLLVKSKSSNKSKEGLILENFSFIDDKLFCFYYDNNNLCLIIDTISNTGSIDNKFIRNAYIKKNNSGHNVTIFSMNSDNENDYDHDVVKSLYYVIYTKFFDGLDIVSAIESISSLLKLKSNMIRKITGLIGELAFIASSNEPDKLVHAWHSKLDSKFDFSSAEFFYEVKTTLSSKRNHFLSSDQINGSGSPKIISIKLAQTETGLKLEDLINIVKKKLAHGTISEFENKLKIYEKIIKKSDDFTFSFDETIKSIKYYNIPRIDVTSENDCVINYKVLVNFDNNEEILNSMPDDKFLSIKDLFFYSYGEINNEQIDNEEKFFNFLEPYYNKEYSWQELKELSNLFNGGNLQNGMFYFMTSAKAIYKPKGQFWARSVRNNPYSSYGDIEQNNDKTRWYKFENTDVTDDKREPRGSNLRYKITKCWVVDLDLGNKKVLLSETNRVNFDKIKEIVNSSENIETYKSLSFTNRALVNNFLLNKPVLSLLAVKYL